MVRVGGEVRATLVPEGQGAEARKAQDLPHGSKVCDYHMMSHRGLSGGMFVQRILWLTIPVFYKYVQFYV